MHGIICTRLLLFITVLNIFLSRIDEDDPGDGSNDCTDLAPDTVESTDDSNDTTHVEVSTVS